MLVCAPADRQAGLLAGWLTSGLAPLVIVILRWSVLLWRRGIRAAWWAQAANDQGMWFWTQVIKFCVVLDGKEKDPSASRLRQIFFTDWPYFYPPLGLLLMLFYYSYVDWQSSRAARLVWLSACHRFVSFSRIAAHQFAFRLINGILTAGIIFGLSPA